MCKTRACMTRGGADLGSADQMGSVFEEGPSASRDFYLELLSLLHVDINIFHQMWEVCKLCLCVCVLSPCARTRGSPSPGGWGEGAHLFAPPTWGICGAGLEGEHEGHQISLFLLRSGRVRKSSRAFALCLVGAFPGF